MSDETPAPLAPRPIAKVRAQRGLDFLTICVSTYRKDLELLDARVHQLRRRGHRNVTRSSLIRIAVEQLDLEMAPVRF